MATSEWVRSGHTNPFGPKVSEEKFCAAVIDLASMNGWLVHHDRGNMRSRIQGNTGMPDLFCCDIRTGRLVLAELKVGKNQLSEPQEFWLGALRKSPAEVYLWRPEDWNAIVKVFSAKR